MTAVLCNTFATSLQHAAPSIPPNESTLAVFFRISSHPRGSSERSGKVGIPILREEHFLVQITVMLQ